MWNDESKKKTWKDWQDTAVDTGEKNWDAGTGRKHHNIGNDGSNGESSGKNKGGKDQNQSNSTNTPDPGWQYTPYAESDVVKQAQAMLQEHMANKPGQYTSPWQAQLNDALNKILNREEFSYDLNGDALYQQYKDQYVNQGQMAMMDTMGQAAALTGGYGNSYAQTVGQQVYQGYLQNLNDKVPELYQLALNKYQMDSQDLLNQYALLGDQENMEYSRYMDMVNQYYNHLDRLQNQYNAERDYDYGKYVDDRDFGYGQYIDDRNFDYQKERDAIADRQWQAEFDEAVRQWQATYDATYGATAAGGGGSSGSVGTGQSATKKAMAGLAGTYGDFTSDTDPNGVVVQSTMKGVANQCDKYIANGASKSEVSAYIDAQRQLGAITVNEAKDLKTTYVPAGYTY